MFQQSRLYLGVVSLFPFAFIGDGIVELFEFDGAFLCDEAIKHNKIISREQVIIRIIGQVDWSIFGATAIWQGDSFVRCLASI
jgi:hypothetical protein